MKYRIGSFSLDVKARTISNGDSCQNIRPKTLALLLYLAERSDQIITKRELLDNIWDDVAVDDGVIFQSVREIRTLFSDPQIVQNFPRKGYQFTAELIDSSSSTDWPSNSRYLAAICSLLFVIIVMFTWITISEDKEEYRESVLVLPVKSYIPYGENDWLHLGGMQQLINQLNQGQESTFVYRATHVLELMERIGLSRELQSQGAQVVLNKSGASMVVETEIHGNVYDYKLIYKLHTANGMHQGVILDTSIPNALVKLSELVISWPEVASHKTDFSQTLLSEAMINYESDWQTSISFFESYLTLNPDSIVAMIYLSKLYLWQGEVDKAVSLTSVADQLADVSGQEKAQVKLLRARTAVRQQDWESAFKWFEQAQSYHQQHKDWFLKANIEEERGLAFMAQCQFIEAKRSFELANTYYQLINSPIGINSSLLHKSHAIFKLGNKPLALLTMQTATENIDEIGIEFLHTMLSKYQTAIENSAGPECILGQSVEAKN